MPIILVKEVEFDKERSLYYISLRELVEVAPHIKEYGTIVFYLIEIKNE